MDNLDFSSDPYARYMSQSPMAATPYLPYDSGQGGPAQAPAPLAPTGSTPAPGVDIGSTLDDASKDIRHWLGPTDIEHKGLFGIHGKMRDILGFLGDVLTGKPNYQNTKKTEAESDAMNGFQEDPQSSIDRMVQVNPDKARLMGSQYATQSEREATARTAADRAAAARQQIEERLQDRALQRAAGMISLAKRTTLKDGTVDPENYKRVSSAVTNFLQRKGITLPDGMSVDDLPGYATAPDKQETQDYRGDMMDYRDRSLDERSGYHQGVLKLGGQRVDETIRHDGVTEGQGATRLDQNGRRIDITDRHYTNADNNAAARTANDTTRTGWGPRGGRRGVAAIPTVNDAASYAKLPNGAAYIDPHGNLKHKGVK